VAGYRTRETFFRPERPVARETSALPADIHNGLMLLKSREPGGTAFLPIRSMQYLAAIDRQEVVFVDAAGGYGHMDGQGGRLIRIAWQPIGAPRESLCDPVPYEILFYFEGLAEIQRRLIGETRTALKPLLAKGRGSAESDAGRRVIPFARS
jgi:hypothetical protein